ncbi:MAG TPA: PmoA family protein [Acidimicrobiia bacterium]|nr:PmoA family protein [Acidimicrobiia bacterium]
MPDAQPWSYATAPPKPHVHPLRAPDGVVLTRDETPDHPWQRGLWFAVKFVNGENFWEELDPFGVQRPGSADVVEWVRPDGDVVITEHRTLRHVERSDGAYAIDWTTVLTPRVEVLLDRTPFTTWGGYGGLAFRGAGDWADTRLLLDDGVETDAVIGTPSRWCDLSSRERGVTFLDHPDNPRHPVPWYGNVRNPLYFTDEWTNFVNAAFLFHEPLTIPARESFTFRYRVIVHAGSGDVASIDRAWGSWAATP